MIDGLSGSSHPTLPPVSRTVRDSTVRPAAERSNVETQQLLDRLFGNKPKPVPNVVSSPRAVPDTDEFAPHLGRYVDVVA